MAKENSTRINIYVTPSVLAKIDAHAEKLGISRSSAISVIAYEYFRSEESIEAMKMVEAISNQMQIQ